MPSLALRVVLQRVADELFRLRDLTVEAQDAAGLLIEAASNRTPVPDAALIGLQTLDALTQHLAALSGLLGAVATDLPDGIGVDPDAAALLAPLGALRARLLGEPVPVQGEADVELF